MWSGTRPATILLRCDAGFRCRCRCRGIRAGSGRYGAHPRCGRTRARAGWCVACWCRVSPGYKYPVPPSGLARTGRWRQDCRTYYPLSQSSPYGRQCSRSGWETVRPCRVDGKGQDQTPGPRWYGRISPGRRQPENVAGRTPNLHNACTVMAGQCPQPFRDRVGHGDAGRASCFLPFS